MKKICIMLILLMPLTIAFADECCRQPEVTNVTNVTNNYVRQSNMTALKYQFAPNDNRLQLSAAIAKADFNNDGLAGGIAVGKSIECGAACADLFLFADIAADSWRDKHTVNQNDRRRYSANVGMTMFF